MTIVLTDLCLLYTMDTCYVTMGCACGTFEETMGISSEPIAWYQHMPCVPWILHRPHGITAAQTMGARYQSMLL
jgi:hypothetical protein